MPGMDIGDRQVGVPAIWLQDERATGCETCKAFHRSARPLPHHVVQRAADQQEEQQ